ncbi:MAG: hypothetical protein KatS3mg129_2636 [Leptospiraceae bacterium]|nr:MAG: hypothetical protein KatS3mg129_2636 [Leptospiraceae bacterium]
MVNKFIFKSLFIILLLNFCTTLKDIEYRIQNPPVSEPKEKTKQLVGGISVVDITPPPTMPLAGYSKNGEIAKGFRHKLKARIFVFTNKKNHSIVLVQMDLLSGSKLLHHKVAEIIAKKYPIRFSDIALFGTHTHAGPGNYFESTFYNNYAASDPGFEPDFFNFLVKQISEGIEKAWENRQPIKIAIGRKKIYGFTKNRSFEAYLKNKNISSNVTKETAINPWIEMIRIDTLDNKPLGVITNFSIHPTIIPEDNIFYHADVFGYIEKGLEDLIKKQYNISFFVHGALNYTHGDSTPNYDDENEEGDFVIAQNIGYGIANEMFDLYQSLNNQFVNDVELNAFSMEIDFLKENQIGNIKICDNAVVGMSLVTGATTRNTPILRNLPFFRPGWPRWFFKDGCQGEKRWLLSKLQHFMLPKEEFPHEIYLQAIQIGNIVYIPYPFEITAETGKLIQNKIKEKYKNFQIIPVSCANGYTGYVTTPEEYSLQYYEGGHTLYGKYTAPFLAEIGNILIENLVKKQNEKLPEGFLFRLKAKQYYPHKPEQIIPNRIIESPPKIKYKEKESYWYFRYWDVPLYYIHFHQPLILLEKSKDCKNNYQNYLNEDSLDLSMHYIKNKEDKTLYEIRWYFRNQEEELLKQHCYRFRILKRNNFDDLISPVIQWKK